MRTKLFLFELSNALSMFDLFNCKITISNLILQFIIDKFDCELYNYTINLIFGKDTAQAFKIGL